MDYSENNIQSEHDTESTAADSIGLYVAAIAQQAIQDRQWREDEWLTLTRQLNGLFPDYDHPVNITKPKTLTSEARISDLLFQAGDKNFSVEPDKDTPTEELPQMQEGSDYLQNSIVNKLDESDYESVGRKTIKYACALGVGVLKGPTISIELEKQWEQVQGADGQVVNTLTMVPTKKAKVEHVPTWDYFPDMSVEDQNSCEFEFQRHWMGKSDLQKLKMRGDFNQQEIMDIINIDSPSEQPRHIIELRDNSNASTNNTERYVIWEGYLTIPAEMVRRLCCESEGQKGIHYQEEDIDSDEFDIECVVWVSDSGRLLKFSPNMLETDERPFSVFCYDRDMACFMASRGIPDLLKTSQQDLNHTWTRIHDNSDLSVGPQWIIDDMLVEPMQEYNSDGTMKPLSWKMTGNKGWRVKVPGADLSQAFTTFNIPSGVEENMVILQKTLEFADTETQLPNITSGDVTTGQTKMAEGTFSLLFNAAGAVPRRIIKDWDDYVTVPIIGRYIDYVMQNEPKTGVFGKFIPNAQGTSSLLLKETMANNAVSLAGIAGSNPKFAERTDWEQIYNEIIRGLQYDPKVVTFTEEELKEQAEANPPQPQPEMIEAQANLLEAQNEQKKGALNERVETWKNENEKTSLSQKAKKDKADVMVSMAKLEVEKMKLKTAPKAKLTETVMKSEAKKEEIRMNSAAKESNMVQEAIIERNPTVNV